MRARAYAEIFQVSPILQVVPAFLPGAAPIANLILLKAGRQQRRRSVFIHISKIIVVRAGQLAGVDLLSQARPPF